MTQIDANAVIEAYQERQKIVLHELMLAQAYIAAQSDAIKNYQETDAEQRARIRALENELGDAHDEIEDLSVAKAEQLLDAKVGLRQMRALDLLRTETGGLVTQIEAVLRGHYDDLDDAKYAEHIENWREYERELKRTSVVETRNGLPITATAEGVREEDAIERPEFAQAFPGEIRDVDAAVRVGRVPGEPR